MQPSRRLCLTGALFNTVELRREVFRAAASYGLVELFAVEDDAFTKLIVQFQRLSASQRMMSDLNNDGAARFGALHASFTPAVPHVGARLVGFSASTTGKAPSSLALAASGCPLTCLVTSSGVPSDLAQLVTRQAIAPLLTILTFPSILEANLFLERSQAALSQNPDGAQEAFLWHLGGDAKIDQALEQVPRLMTVEEASLKVRQTALPSVVRKGGVPGGDIELDCGIVTKKGRSVTVFAKCPASNTPQRGDFVEVQLTSIGEDLGRATLVASKPRPQPAPTPLAARLMSILQRGGGTSSATGGGAQIGFHSLPGALQLNDVCTVTVTGCTSDKITGLTTVLATGDTSDDAFGSPTHAASKPREVVVEIPLCFIPGVSAENWCVVGEKISACIIAATAVGGSEATLKLVGSLRQVDLERRGQFKIPPPKGSSSTAALGSEPSLQNTMRGVPTAFWPTSPSGKVWLFRSEKGNRNVVHALQASPDVAEGKSIDALVVSRTPHVVILRSSSSAASATSTSLISRASGVEDALRAVFGEDSVESGRKRPRSDEGQLT